MKFSGDHSAKATPDSIPNSEVKLCYADGTSRETVWESRTSPVTLNRKGPFRPFFLYNYSCFVSYIYIISSEEHYE